MSAAHNPPLLLLFLKDTLRKKILSNKIDDEAGAMVSKCPQGDSHDVHGCVLRMEHHDDDEEKHTKNRKPTNQRLSRLSRYLYQLKGK